MMYNEPPTLSQAELWQSSLKDRAKLSRRHFLSVGTAAAVAAVLQGSRIVTTAAAADRPPSSGRARIGAAVRTNNFPEPKPAPPNAQGNTDLGDVHLGLKQFKFCQGEGKIRSYNGFTPGPTIFADPGGKITLTLYNDLPKNQGSATGPDFCGQPDMNKPHCFNTTNMHFHGLHVSPCSQWDDGIPNCAPGHHGQPKLASDDVLLEIPPLVEGGKPQPYCIWLPAFHAPGTHWYHAHKHGSTALQVANGTAGALIVREREPIIRPDNDFIWVIQEILKTGDDAKIYPGAGRPPTFFLVNGECQPTLQTDTGKTLRLRFINATGTPQGFARLLLVKCSNNPNATCDATPVTTPTKTMYLMAVDGITFYGHKPQPKQQWDLAAGNRADFLVKFGRDEAGVYKVVRADVPGIPAKNPQVLGYIRVQLGAFNDPDPQNIQLPPWSAAPDYLQPIQKSEINGTQTIKFQNPGAGNFMVNDRKYSHDPQFDIKVPLGCTQAWTLLNFGLGGSNSIRHPFHVHVNPFQLAEAPKEIKLMDPSGPDVPENWIWWDTIAIPPQLQANGDPGKLVMWSRFRDYPGNFVLHCHILVHEDIGMMANVRVEDPLSLGVGPCQQLTTPIPVKCQS